MATAAALEAVKYFQTLLPELPDPAGPTKAYRDQDELAYVLSQIPMGTPRAVKIIVVGAGFSGLCFAREVDVGTLKSACLTVYEKNNNVGGTWYENRYPGCACDIPSHNYQFSWAPNPRFKSYYAGQPDIQAYIDAMADQHNLRQYVKTSHKVVGARWIEERQKWEVAVRRTDGRDLTVSNRSDTSGEVGEIFMDECDVLVNGTGFVNEWKWPSIPQRETFKGQILHSASWNTKSDLKGHTVALIGNGSSGVQILPAILDKAKKIYVFMRSPTWITAGFAQKFAGPDGSNVTFTQEQKDHWAENPDDYLQYRKEVENELNGRFRLYLKDSLEQQAAKDFSIKQMQEKLAKKPELLKVLIPDFAVGCRRPTPGNGYLEALCADKVEVIWGEIDSFTPNGLRSASGVEVSVDTIICATGFNITFSPRFPVIGRNGVDLGKVWDDNPECYLSMTAANMPNYLVYLGPGSPLGHGSVTSSIEILTAYMIDLVTKLQTENYGSFCPKSHIPGAWQKHALKWLEKTSWNTPCVSTFKNGTKDGPLVSLHPGSRLQYFKLLQTRRYEDFDWMSLCPDTDLTFAWTANGFTLEEAERKPGFDPT
ncbi:related to steroid monooxygenase [Phialocephala subalpina]|uniref:Related to steroid monooxygenase n=1 Tax=Phialocephala subalpina TaxID=576137 RepID=A0A1L7XVI5_9HELO|nr:related to steroid monooxygenase [Phialocephala subalpina]